MPVGRAGGERSVCRGEEDVSEARGGGGAGALELGVQAGREGDRWSPGKPRHRARLRRLQSPVGKVGPSPLWRR